MTILKKEKKAAVLEKQLLRKSNSCVKVVTLKKCEEVASTKKSYPEKMATYGRREVVIWNKETKLGLWLCLVEIIFPERLPHLDKY